MASTTFRRISLIVTVLLLFPLLLSAIAVTIAVKDPDGAAVPGAEVVIQGRTLTSDATTGSVSLPDLPEGAYTVTVRKPGFETAEQRIEVKAGQPASFTIQLKIAAQQITVEVDSKRSSLANSDPNYRALRTAAPVAIYRIENLELKRDVGTLNFQKGQFTFFAPVLGKTVMAVFTGEGTFHLKPLLPVDATYLNSVSGASEISENFRSVVLCFTDETAAEIRKAALGQDESSKAMPAFQEFRSRVRRRGDEPRSLVEALLGGDQMANVEADLLAELYAPRRQSFSAYIHGAKHADLRFLVSDSGALAHLPSPEEVAVINRDPDGEQDGIWYMSHLRTEWAKGTASSSENRRWVMATRYKIDTAIANNDHLSGECTVDFRVLVDNARIVKFGLLPNLRVRNVKQGGQDIGFIQESRTQDGSFYAVLPAAQKAGADVQLVIDYEGDKVVRNSGGGTFAVAARTSWYPSLNTFTDRTPYDLTFRVPRKYSLVSVGKLDKTWKEQNYDASHWVSELPLAVAGFNYGDFKKIEKKDEQTGYSVEVYSTSDVPDFLRGARQNMVLSPSALAQSAMVDTMNSIRVFETYFGKLPYGHIAITEQPQMFFGQSWPELVYLPLTAFLDQTQRWELFGTRAFKLAEFVDEVTPHEVSHQWWGHAVGWGSYHDQWISEGFADFSAALFLQATGKQEEFKKYMERQRKRIVEKNNFGLRANDAGPVWLGIRLDTFKNPRAYNNIVYPKGGFIVQMLRSLMWDKDTQDKDFREMMQDLVATGFNKSVTTENFNAIASKHMKPSMDLGGDHTLTWFFNEWVYGTELPRYKMEYSLQPGEHGQFILTGHITQSGVSDNFRMKVPVYAELDKEPIRLGSVTLTGNSTSAEFKIPLPKKPKLVAANLFADVLAEETVNQQK
jgi:hypothetical protein